jgi:hypothetical protein
MVYACHLGCKFAKGYIVTPGFRKTNQVHTYMYARIKFHTYSRQKWITVTVSRKEHKQNLQIYQSYTTQSWKRSRQLHKQPTGATYA